jgi:hypothetical protein
MFEDQSVIPMNSPHPLSPPAGGKRGYEVSLPLLLPARESRLRDRRSQRGWGVEFMHFQNIPVSLLLIPDSHKNIYNEN